MVYNRWVYKSGNFTKELEALKMSYIAFDTYGHGDYIADEEDFDNTHMSDDLWPKYISESVKFLQETVTTFVLEHKIEVLNFITYSTGCLVGVKSIATLKNIPIKHVVMCVPTPQKEYDDTYSLHNNMSQLEESEVHICYGLEDDEVPPEESQWFYDQLQVKAKTCHTYTSSHALPVEWVKDMIGLIASI